MLGVALIAARKGYAAGDPVLAHSGNDDGRRAAIVLSAKGQT
jgi:3-oxoacyl-[acyl-carrier-protein] synthase-1